MKVEKHSEFTVKWTHNEREARREDRFARQGRVEYNDFTRNKAVEDNLSSKFAVHSAASALPRKLHTQAHVSLDDSFLTATIEMITLHERNYTLARCC